MGVKARRGACLVRPLPVGLQFCECEVERPGVVGCSGLQGHYWPSLCRLFRSVPQVLLIRTPRLPGCAGGGTFWSASVPAPRPHEVSSSSRPRPQWPSIGLGIGSTSLGRATAGTVATKVSTDVRPAAGNCDATALAGYWSGGGCHSQWAPQPGRGPSNFSPWLLSAGSWAGNPFLGAILSTLGTAGRRLLPEGPRAQARDQGQRPPVIGIGHRKG